jgi:ATP-dependent DNA ligase
MTAKVVQALPEWLYEVKHDGYWAFLLKDGEDVQIRSRNEQTLLYREVEEAARGLKAESLVLDGEIVAVDGEGPSVLPSTATPQRVPEAHRRVLASGVRPICGGRFMPT